MRNIITIKTGEVVIGVNDDVIKTHGIGSCIAICLYSKELKIGGMAHAMLPGKGSYDSHDTKYVEAAIEKLISELKKHNCTEDKIKAKLIGGANMFEKIRQEQKKDSIGNRNVESAKKKLADLEIPIENMVIGGTAGRTVEFLVKGIITVKTVI